MTLYPDVQAKAKAELNSIVGTDRPPTLSDRAKLPYTNALISEVLRFGLVTPSGTPHILRVDDVHDGYYLPKESVIMPNIAYVLSKLMHDDC
jgi:cytochrome P450